MFLLLPIGLLFLMSCQHPDSDPRQEINEPFECHFRCQGRGSTFDKKTKQCRCLESRYEDRNSSVFIFHRMHDIQ